VDVNNTIQAIIMKKSIFFILLITAAFFQGCKPELKEIGPEYAAGEGIYGIWIVSDLSQVDLTVPLPETQNIFSFFSSNESSKMIIRFEKENSAYSIIQPGNMPRETDNRFLFKLNRTDSCGVNYLRYDYTFSRVQ